jgi:hypothetical protein
VPKVSDLFPSKYVSVEDLKDHAHIVKIERILDERIYGDAVHVVFFKDRRKGLILRQIVAFDIADFLGEEVSDWPGEEVELYPGQLELRNGKLVDMVRVRLPGSGNPPPDSGTGF